MKKLSKARRKKVKARAAVLIKEVRQTKR